MNLIPLRTVKSILLKIPNSTLIEEFSNTRKTVFEIDNTIIIIPTKGINVDHLTEILEYQLEMSWWMIDYIFGENGIQ